MNVSVHEAKTHFSRLLVRVEAGEDVVIDRSGKPFARLIPVGLGGGRALIGALRDTIDLSHFDDPLPDDFIAAFLGESA